MNSSRCPRFLRAASVLAVVALALAVAPAAHANGWMMGTPEGRHLLALIMVVGAVGFSVLVALGIWQSLQAAARSARPGENIWAPWSLVLGLGGPMFAFLGSLFPFGPFAIWTGIKAHRIGGRNWMAVVGIVLGAVGTLRQVLELVYIGLRLVMPG